jgi:UDP-N-acetylglucosamine/UDP-N-acetylgalactosamine diphosphorylase
MWTQAMPTLSEELRQRLRQHRQEHVLAWWDELGEAERGELLGHLEALDLAELGRLYEQRNVKYPVPSSDKIAAVPVLRRDDPHQAEDRALGEAALRRGEVAALVVAGGQGSRLGFKMPKGMFPVGPVSGKTLFQIHAEKVLALRRRYQAPLPFLVMTSPATDAETRRFFSEQRFFGLTPDDLHFFRQGTMPALDLGTGRLLLEKRGRLFLSPDGHGGTLTALKRGGLLDQLLRQGVKHLFYFQVDNPLVKVADPLFLGQHLRQCSEASSKIVGKLGPEDKLGNFTQVDGRCTMIEYSDLPKELAKQTDSQGNLRLWAGSPAIHFFDLGFLARVVGQPDRLPFHLARKKVPCLDEQGRDIQPASENALKFERFIFDVLPLAERWLLVETTREEEFAPLKNDSGPDSPETVQQALIDQAAAWLESAGVKVPRDPQSKPQHALEISPLFALDPTELSRRAEPGLSITGARYFG